MCRPTESPTQQLTCYTPLSPQNLRGGSGREEGFEGESF